MAYIVAVRLFIILIISTVCLPLLSQRTDLLFLPNGDVITGEIKKLEFGALTYKTDDLGTMTVKWTEVGKLKSTDYFEFILGSGIRIFGSIDTTSEFRIIRILSEEDTFDIKLLDIIEITPIKGKFLARIDGSVDLGYNFTKGSEVTKFTFTGRVDYRGEQVLSYINIFSDITVQPERDDTRKQDATYSFKYIFSGDLFGNIFIGASQNTELGLESRIFSGIGIGKDFVHNNFHQFLAQIGIMGNRENATEGASSTNNLEAYGVVQYRVFRKNIPKVDLNTTFIAIPSFTVKNRWRLEYDIKAKFELISDFYFSLSFYYQYDNKPPNSKAASFDYGITTSIGYSF